MIAELAAANAAFDVIKQTVSNGREIYEAGEAMARYFGLKSEIQKRAHEHGYKNDLEAFMASEQLAAKEAELKEMFIYQGRPGMWDDWLQFQLEMKRSREQQELEEKRAKHKRKKMLLDGILWGAVLSVAVLAIGSLIYLIIAVSKYS